MTLTPVDLWYKVESHNGLRRYIILVAPESDDPGM